MSANPEEKANASEAIERLKRAVSVESDADLAALLSVSRTTLSNWRKRNSLPLARVRAACRRLGVPLEYVLTGRAGADVLAKPYDTEMLAYVFRMLERYRFIAIPRVEIPDYDPARRAAAEFVELLQQVTELIAGIVRDEGVSASEARRRVFSRSPESKGPQ